jgi:hypothetical protein
MAGGDLFTVCWYRVNGERDRIRTCDPVIKSHLLYQLSYAPELKNCNRAYNPCDGIGLHHSDTL